MYTRILLFVFTVSFTSTAQALVPATETIELRLNMPGITFFSAEAPPGLGIIVGDPSTTFFMGLGGGMGYFIMDRLELGGIINIGVTAIKDGSAFNLSLGPFIRYVIPISQKIHAWMEGQIGYFYFHQRFATQNNISTANENEFHLGLLGGLDFLLNEKVAIYAGFGVDLYAGTSLVVPIGITYGLRAYL